MAYKVLYLQLSLFHFILDIQWFSHRIKAL